MLEELTIEKANQKLERLANILDMLLSRKELLFSRTQPQTNDITKERVSGGQAEDKFLKYVIELDEEELDRDIEYTQNEMFITSQYIDKELKIRSEYEPLKAKIVMLKEKGMTNENIAIATGYCVRQVIRIYKEHLRRRYFE